MGDNAMLPEPLAAVAIIVGLAPGYLLAVLLPVLGAFSLKFFGEGGRLGIYLCLLLGCGKSVAVAFHIVPVAGTSTGLLPLSIDSEPSSARQHHSPRS